MNTKPILIVGGTGKTGRRVAERLLSRGLPVRIGSRTGENFFNWEKQASWAPSLSGVSAVYITYFPDLAVPGAATAIGSFAELAVSHGVKRLVLLTDPFTKVLDGFNSHLTDGIQRALGREPRDFADYARAASAAGVWGGSI
ncbi:SDR family oxidoreductase [Paenibacillus nasutitermitis]|uniref:NmrA family transcriptional regulator n=1 Tax=Paenibacillus nasutitermitis TaxID=1652958 RepID=A0A916ZF85_9BACL|nr:NAD(P)H-binding protein [Paenibacillus nasutitermitis]GGD93953.1 hypothetical protein GCM10010911_60800 [Paenibacillus nasutitermitis]